MSMVALRDSRLPRRLGWLGVVIGVVGLASIVPLLNDATVVFGLLEFAWFVLARSRAPADAWDNAARRHPCR